MLLTYCGPVWPTEFVPLYSAEMNPVLHSALESSRESVQRIHTLWYFWKVLCLCAKLLELHTTLCNPLDCSPLGSPVQGILKARILEWVVMPSSKGSSQYRDWTHISLLYWQAGSLPLPKASILVSLRWIFRCLLLRAESVLYCSDPEGLLNRNWVLVKDSERSMENYLYTSSCWECT